MPGFFSQLVLCGLFVLFGCFSVGHGCTHDSLAGPPYNPTHLQYPMQNGKRQTERKPMRFKVIYDWKDTSVTQAQQTLMENVLVPETVKWLSSRLSVTPVQGNFAVKPFCSSSWTGENPVCAAAPDAPTCGGTAIPMDYVQSIQYCTDSPTEGCTNSPGGIGVPGIDFLLIVNAPATACSGNTLAFASHCSMDQNDRPIAGFMTMCPSSFQDLTDPPTPQKVMNLISTLVHEISHALAFSSSLFPYYRDGNNAPRVKRTASGQPEKDAEIGVIKNTFTERGHTVTKVISPAVLAEVRDHFACPDLNGAELEDQGGPGSVGSHWEERIFYGEYMTSTDPFSRPSYTTITAALFRDSGWYDVDYSQWQINAYGRRAGCALAREKCVQGDQSQPLPSDPAYFCQPRDDDYQICSGDRLSTAWCSTSNYLPQLESHYQWYSLPSKGGATTISDYCPRFSGENYVPSENKDCLYRADTTEQPTLEKVGLSSRCFMATIVKQGYVVPPSPSGRCYPVKCKYENSKPVGLDITVGGLTLSCTQENTVVNLDDAEVGRGQITCPAFNLVCPEGGDCPDSCSGYGVCRNGKCICYPGFSGGSCSTFPIPSTTKRNGQELRDAVQDTYNHIEIYKRSTTSPAMQFGMGFNSQFAQRQMKFFTDDLCLAHASKFLDMFPIKLTDTLTYPVIYASILSSLAEFLTSAQNEKTVTCFPQAAVFSKAITSQTDPLFLRPLLKELYLLSVLGKWEELGSTSAQIALKAGAVRKSADMIVRPNYKIPSSWECDNTTYGTGDGCDCDCGAIDPDCIGSSDPALLFNCNNGPLPRCVNATCTYGSLPSSWTCHELTYGTGDGCDCECGAYDPDCDLHPDDLWGCEDGDATCSKSGHCVYQAFISSTWLCSLDDYNNQKYCDCNCGAWDPDCDIPTLPNDCLCPSSECVKSNVNGTIQGVCVGACIGVRSELITDSPSPTPSSPSPTPSSSTPTTPPTPSNPSGTASSSNVININFANIFQNR